MSRNDSFLSLHILASDASQDRRKVGNPEAGRPCTDSLAQVGPEWFLLSCVLTLGVAYLRSQAVAIQVEAPNWTCRPDNISENTPALSKGGICLREISLAQEVVTRRRSQVWPAQKGQGRNTARRRHGRSPVL